MHTHEKREPLKSNQAMQWFESDHQVKVGSECMATLPILVWYKYLSSHWTKNFLDTFQGKNVVTCSGTKKRRHKKRGQRKKKVFPLNPSFEWSTPIWLAFIQFILCAVAVPPYVPNLDGAADTSHFDEFEPESPDVIAHLEKYNLNDGKGFTGKDLPFVGFTFSRNLANSVPFSPRK